MASSVLRATTRVACKRRLLQMNTESINPYLCRLYRQEKHSNTRLAKTSTDDVCRLFSTQAAVREQQQDKNNKAPETNADEKAANEDQWNRSIKEAVEKARREMEQQGRSPEPKERRSTKESKEESEDYLTTLGKVMMELPTQLESFFERGLDGSIYSDKVVFSEPTHSGLNISGKTQYIGLAKVSRIAMNAYFQNPSFTIVSMRQIPIIGEDPAKSSDTPGNGGGRGGHLENDGQETQQQNNKSYDVFIRWVFEGLPRHTDIIGGCESRYEGEFRYRMDPKSGLIALHELSSIHPTPPAALLSKTGLARWVSWLSPRGSLSLTKGGRLIACRCPLIARKKLPLPSRGAK